MSGCVEAGRLVDGEVVVVVVIPFGGRVEDGWVEDVGSAPGAACSGGGERCGA